jgi:hypothetical protein
MKLSYKVWLVGGPLLPFNKEGKLIFEPYKGFMTDLHELKYLENEMKSGRKLKSAVDNLELKIMNNTTKWKQGQRW